MAIKKLFYGILAKQRLRGGGITVQTGTKIMILTFQLEHFLPETNIMRQGQAFIKQFFVNFSGTCEAFLCN